MRSQRVYPQQLKVFRARGGARGRAGVQQCGGRLRVECCQVLPGHFFPVVAASLPTCAPSGLLRVHPPHHRSTARIYEACRVRKLQSQCCGDVQRTAAKAGAGPSRIFKTPNTTGGWAHYCIYHVNLMIILCLFVIHLFLMCFSGVWFY